MKSITVTKTCYMCKHLATNMDDGEWRWHGSDLTPPTPFKIFCRKEVWSYYEGPIEELRDGLMNAHGCPHYDPLPLYATPISPEIDYVGHISRPPYCKSCGSNIRVLQPIIVNGTYIYQYVSYCPECDKSWKDHPTIIGVYREVDDAWNKPG